MSIYLHKVKSRWQPGENTVAYYPLASDFNDASGNSRNLTNSGATITTQGGIACGYWNGSSYAEYSGYGLTSAARTINARCYCTQASGVQGVVHISAYSVTSPSGSLGIKFNNGNTNVGPADWTNASAESVTANVTVGWHNIITTQSGSTTKLYVDGSLIGTISNYPSETNTPNGWSLGSKFYSTHSEKLTGYLSAVILEDKERSAEEIEDYYMFTKGDYYTETQWEVNEHTLSYFPLKNDSDDVIGTRSLTLNGVTVSDGTANVSAKTSYMQLSNTIGGTNMTASLWYYPTSFNSSGNGDWNTIFARNGGTYHHLLISGGNSAEGTVGRIGFWNNSWIGSSAVLNTNKWYNIIMTKSGANEKIYVDGRLVLDSNSSFDNASYQLGIIANYTNSNGDQGAHGKISEVIFEDKVWTADEALSYYYQTRNDYVDNPWYPVKEYEVENIYIGDIGWEPNENTLLYLPLKEDLLDHSQYNRTITQTGTITKDSTGYKFYQSYLTSSTFSGPSICTLSVWAYMVGTGGTHAVIAEKYYGPNSPYITTNLACFNGTYEPTIEYRNSSQTLYQALSGTSIQGGWHHIVGTYDGTNGTIYVDNVLKATVSVSGNLLSTNTAFVVGTFLGNTSGQWFNGYISDVIFEDKVWTAQEIQDYYNQTKSNYGL